MLPGGEIMKIVVFLFAWLASASLILAQERFDPFAASGGGVWIRRGWDPWCALDAQPNLSFVNAPRIGVVHSPGAFQLSELSTSSITFVFPIPSGGAGIALTRFGFDLYSEHAGVIAWGGGSGPLRFGACVRYTHIAIRGYGSAGVAAVDVGSIVAPISWFRAGVRLTDVTRSSIGSSGEHVRATLSMAVMFILPDVLDVSLQVGQDAAGGLSYRTAVSVRCSRWMELRSGASENLNRLHAGIRLDGGHAGVGYGLSVDPALGWSHTFSLFFTPPV